MEKNELIQKLEASVRRTNRNFMMVGSIIIGLCGLIIWATFTDEASGTFVKAFDLLFMAGLLVLVFLMGKKIFAPNPLVDYVNYHPDMIVEVQEIRIVRRPSGRDTYQKNLHFKTSDGKTLVLTDKKIYIDELIEPLKKVLKHARFV